MTSKAPIKKEHDIPIIKIREDDEPRRLSPGIAVPNIVRPVRVPELVPVRRKI